MNILTKAGVALLLGALSSCQPREPRVPRPWASAAPATGNVVAEGVVLSEERPRPEDTQSYVHVVLLPSDQQPIRLVLAPGWYLDAQGLRFVPNERLRVEGKRSDEGGPTLLVVHRLQRGDRSYMLRDERDQPAWSKP